MEQQFLQEEKILFQSFLQRHLNHQASVNCSLSDFCRAKTISSVIAAVNSDDLDEKAKPPVVQQRGRFKVTSENVDLEKVAASPILQKSHSMQVLTPTPIVSLASPSASSTPAANNLIPLLQSVLQTNILQRDNILNLMKHICAGDSIANRAFEGLCTPANVAVSEKSLLEVGHDREKELLQEITELRWRLICAQEELQKYKTENAEINLGISGVILFRTGAVIWK
ncbi:hypothetical protein REPUB_Repub13aG0203500 [Reevesia pubescens]